MVDFHTGFRWLHGQLSSWALAAGGAIVGVVWGSTYQAAENTGPGPWPSEIQYVSVVLLCWGTLMYAYRNRDVFKRGADEA